jgi:hypothetical protein
MAYEDFTRAEGVSVRAARRRVGDPLPSGGSYEFTQHDYQPMTDARCDAQAAKWGWRPPYRIAVYRGRAQIGCARGSFQGGRRLQPWR